MWKEADTLERDIILFLHKNPHSITDIAEKVKRAKPTISKTIERMQNQGLVTKTHNYTKDSRKVEISINLKRIKVERTHTFYFIYFILAFFSSIVLAISTYFSKNLFLLIGGSIGIVPPLLFIIYSAYIKGDKVLVYKNPKVIEREKKKKVQEK